MDKQLTYHFDVTIFVRVCAPGAHCINKVTAKENLLKCLQPKYCRVAVCIAIKWDKIRCSFDRQPVQEGLLPEEQVGRYPWLGVIQYDFYSADTMRYSITGAVLIHPEYALAPAEDMAKIDKDILRNSTYFIVWYSPTVKYTMGVESYNLNKEYETLTYATTALVKIVRDRTIELGDPGKSFFPCFIALGGYHYHTVAAFRCEVPSDEFACGDDSTMLRFAPISRCPPGSAVRDVYERKCPEHKMLVPTYPICASAQGVHFTCFMESGSVLVSRDSNEYWTLTLAKWLDQKGQMQKAVVLDTAWMVHRFLSLQPMTTASETIKWNKVRCSVDRAPIVEGVVSPDQMGRFPWLGVIQHDFCTYSSDLYGKKRSFSVTGAVRIHASYALAPAEDMAMINRKTISNTTHFIVWHSADLKYSIGVEDYIMHPEYEDRRTYATTALVELMIVESNQVGHPAPVLPICLPAKNHPSFDKIYVVKMTTGDDGQILKEIISMIAIDNKDCDIFYEKAELDFKMMLPSQPICATTLEQQPACIWDGGAVLVTREPDSYWTLLGFGVRGPGCGAPARFVDVQSQLLWIDPQVSATT
ncbi:uncharacterized protein LOC133526602 [Cydia pomonella]|uniref:uncharacterized protein LOC133526602 n=1 Tax=Cydia pomonella TaxID=82600 RepID=UPI002ADE0A86|nr:uncharacterized protein LOC133526602 [Cydia pomonella]